MGGFPAKERRTVLWEAQAGSKQGHPGREFCADLRQRVLIKSSHRRRENRSWGRDAGSRDADSPGLKDSVLIEGEGSKGARWLWGSATEAWVDRGVFTKEGAQIGECKCTHTHTPLLIQWLINPPFSGVLHLILTMALPSMTIE